MSKQQERDLTMVGYAIEYTVKKYEENLNDLFKLIEEWEGSAWALKEDERYLELKDKLYNVIKK